MLTDMSDGRRFWKALHALFCIGIFIVGIPAFVEAKPKSNPPPSADDLHPDSVEEMNQMLSKLTDEQVRQILIRQLEKTIPVKVAGDGAGSGSGLMNRLDHFPVLFKERFAAIGRNLPLFIDDIDNAAGKLTEGKGAGSSLQMLLILSAIIGLSIGAERIWWRLSAGMRARFDAAPAMQGWMRFITGLLKLLPDFLGIFIFSLAGLILFELIPESDLDGWRMLFITLMMLLILVRLTNLLSQLILSPNAVHLRLITVGDTTAQYLHKWVTRLAGYWVVLNIVPRLGLNLGLPPDSLFLLVLAMSIPFMATLVCLILNNRAIVAQYLRQTGLKSSGEISWLRGQLASAWHILVSGYIALLWVLAIVRFALFGPRYDQAFIVSFLIIPLYLILNHAGKWVISETLGTVRKTEIDENTGYFKLATGLVRVIVCISLVLWLFNIWGIRVPFIEHAIDAAFSILVTLVLAHVIWGMTNRYIQKQLEAMVPSSEANADDEEEFSGQTPARSFTLLPVLRKFVGTVLMVMVTLIVLSSLGVNIAPLMAGAGVAGLAIGFGSQKLVADVLSGIFYLVDDTFRVGEYIQAGSVSGTVEGFTLRNIMLRHDKGAMQIVPFSKLGAVTNYNRGGAVVKFNLSLPYDTNIAQVRKIIKKVGQQLMEDPELGPDIIRPLKSMGVKTVVDSVMTFRARFTSRFGRQGMIQRKAFELITEALAKKGIHYAHRRVIVELPPGFEKEPGAGPGEGSTGYGIEDHLKAGAAAALVIEADKRNRAMAKKPKPESI